MTPGIRRLIGSAGVAALLLLSSPHGSAQRRPAAESAVYVRDSGVAAEKLALAERLEHLKEWDRSADLYLEIVRDFPDRVIAAGPGEQHYVNLESAVQSRLAHWPREGVAAFRARYEAPAEASHVAAGHDSALLKQLLAQYLLTDAGKAAALTLVNARIELGQFTAAIALAQRVLDEHPTLSADERAEFRLRIGTAHRLSGNVDHARDVLAQLRRESPEAITRVDDKDVRSADALAAILESPATRPAAADDRWLTPGGDGARSRVAARPQFGGTRLGYRDVDQLPPHGVPKASLDGFQHQLESSRPLGYSTGVFPVFDRGQIFFQDNARVYAIDADSGEPLSGWQRTYPSSGIFVQPDAWPLPQGQPCLLTVTEDSVLATMGVLDFAAVPYVGLMRPHTTRLVCLDRESGRLRWTLINQQLPENLSALDFAGCPLVEENTVYVQAHGSRGNFDDAYLLALDRRDGALLWSCYLCSANLGSADGDPTATPSPVATALASDGGRLFVQTNNGAVACVDAQSGSALWISVYSRDETADRDDLTAWAPRRAAFLGARKPWEHNLPMLSGGRLYVMPDDASSLLVYDPASGKLLRRLLLSDYDQARTLIGVVGDKAIFSSSNQLFCVDWNKYPSDVSGEAVGDGESPPPRADAAIVWATTPLKRPGMPEDAVRGRGIVTADSVILPTAWQLMRFTIGGGSLKQAFPLLPQPQWNDDEGPGNVLFAGDWMIVAGTTRGGAQRVSWYTDYEQARRRLEAAEAAAPRQVDPLLRSARALYTAGQAGLSRAKLDAAIALAPSDQADELSKSKLYDTAIDLARRAAADSRADTTVVDGFFDRAQPYVSGPMQQVDFRIIRADYARQQENAAGVVDLYQQILAVPAWRDVNLVQGDRTLTAGDLAAETIGLIRESSSSAYDAIERAAQTAFSNAQAAQTIDQWIETARTFPNSSIAGKAYGAAGEQAQFAGDHRRAVQLFRLALASVGETDERLQLLQRMAQSYVQLPNGLPTAAGRLRQAARLVPTAKLSGPIGLPNGRSFDNLSYAEAARQLDAEASPHVAAVPDCAIPPNVRVPGTPRKRTVPFTIKELTSLNASVLSLLDSPDTSSRTDRVVAKTRDGVVVLRPGDTEPLCRVDHAPRVMQSAWLGESLALLEPKVISLVTGDTGRPRWQQRLDALPPPPRLAVAVGETSPTYGSDEVDGVSMEWRNRGALRRARRLGWVTESPQENSETFTQLAALMDRVILSTSRGRVMALDLNHGELLWQRQIGEHAIVRLLANDDFVLAQTQDGRAAPFVIDSLDGRLLHGNEAAANTIDNRVLSVALASDGMLVTVWPRAMVIKDLFEPGAITQPTFRFPPQSLAVTFDAATDPQSVQIQGRRVYALTDGGVQLRVVSLDTGKAIMFNQSQAIATGARMGTSLDLLADEQHGYVGSENWVRGYDLQHGTSWGDQINTPQIRDLALSQTHLIALANQPPAEGDKESRQYELQCFSRASDSRGAESGWLEYRYSLPRGLIVTEWQLAEGGIFLLGNDRRLYWAGGNATR